MTIKEIFWNSLKKEIGPNVEKFFEDVYNEEYIKFNKFLCDLQNLILTEEEKIIYESDNIGVVLASYLYHKIIIYACGKKYDFSSYLSGLIAKCRIKKYSMRKYIKTGYRGEFNILRPKDLNIHIDIIKKEYNRWISSKKNNIKFLPFIYLKIRNAGQNL